MTDTAKRPFGVWMATALVVGGMIGSGIFVLPAQLAPYGSAGLAAWVASVVGAGALAWVLSALAAAYPGETGLVAIGARALGPFVGTLIGWSYWVGVWSANAIIAITAIRYLAVFVPALAATPLALALSSIGAIWLLTLLNLGGARTAGRFQVATTVLKVLPLIAVILILASLFVTGDARFGTAPQSAFKGDMLMPAMTLAFFALVGFEGASVAAERVRDPARNVMRATLAGLALTGVVYILVCSGIDYALPERVVADATAPVALFVETFWSRGAGLMVAAFAVIATVGALNGWVLIQGEVPLGMARAGLLPRWFATTSSRDVPTRVLVLASLLASVLVLSNASRSTAGLLDFMLRLATAATLWLYAGACVAALRMGIARIAATIGLVFAIAVFWGAGVEAGGLSLLLMASAIPFYLLRGTPRPIAA